MLVKRLMITAYCCLGVSFILIRLHGIMLAFLAVVLFAPACTHALLHHLAVGTVNGQALYSLEMDDESRMVYTIQARDAGGSSPSLALDVRTSLSNTNVSVDLSKRSKHHLFSSRPQDGTLTRHSIAPTYELISEGTMVIPSSCQSSLCHLHESI